MEMNSARLFTWYDWCSVYINVVIIYTKYKKIGPRSPNEKGHGVLERAERQILLRYLFQSMSSDTSVRLFTDGSGRYTKQKTPPFFLIAIHPFLFIALLLFIINDRGDNSLLDFVTFIDDDTDIYI